jgi:hypothetical protein
MPTNKMKDQFTVLIEIKENKLRFNFLKEFYNYEQFNNWVRNVIPLIIGITPVKY